MGTFLSDIVLQILSFVAQNERDSIKNRQAEGIKAARARGAHMGRPVKRPPDNFNVLAKQWAHGELRTSDFMKVTGLTETTLYRRLREIKVVRTPYFSICQKVCLLTKRFTSGFRKLHLRISVHLKESQYRRRPRLLRGIPRPLPRITVGHKHKACHYLRKIK